MQPDSPAPSHPNPLWQQHPQVWFLQIEAQYTVASVSSQHTRNDHLITTLPNEIALEVYDILPSLPPHEPNGTWKAAILE